MREHNYSVGWGKGRAEQRTGQQSQDSKLGDKMNSLNKQMILGTLKNYKLLSRMYGNAIMSCDFLESPYFLLEANTLLTGPESHCTVD